MKIFFSLDYAGGSCIEQMLCDCPLAILGLRDYTCLKSLLDNVDIDSILGLNIACSYTGARGDWVKSVCLLSSCIELLFLARSLI